MYTYMYNVLLCIVLDVVLRAEEVAEGAPQPCLTIQYELYIY